MSKIKTANKANIVILGAGSIGCYLGGCLLSIGANVTLIGRARLKDQIANSGLTLTDWRGRNTKLKPADINFTENAEVMASADYILVCVKSGDTQEAASLIAEYENSDSLKDNPVVISFQNGVRNGQVLSECLPNHTVMKGMVPFNVLGQGDGHFHCGTEGNLCVEDKTGKSGDLVALFDMADLPVHVYKDLSSVQWGKLLMNLNNAVNALSGRPLLEQLHDNEYRKVMAVVLKEALVAMKAAGIEPAKTGKVVPKLMPYIMSLPNFLFKKVAAATLKIDPQARSSMYEDLALNRKTEVDYLNGEIVALGEAHQVSTPANTAIVKLIKAAENARDGSPRLSAATLQQAIVAN
ncbi:2-dehydropantoate 2-reductase [Alteromonas sp. 38]|uniref:2-dehydropantoate 2-reductase n=1 Tax=Alteromonas TaxID=226 RepID=UPI0012EEEF17|nr:MULTISPECIES: 2-dehydropantoate 2-reductase [Alteromonas]CAD5282816.1 2-dehydropantoate 2-reductase [Alteromonas sp. 154]VXB90809.1 2-dehydropantoate 2-reductase [Alteromonas sp. 38]